MVSKLFLPPQSGSKWYLLPVGVLYTVRLLSVFEFVEELEVPCVELVFELVLFVELESSEPEFDGELVGEVI